ncbi:MAG: hypothetical protein WAZ44_00940 [Minisyncoccia bacterium]
MNKWVILVCPTQKNAWIVSRTYPSYEIGDLEVDQSRVGDDWFVGAFFDSHVEEMINAICLLGGDSIETNDKISGLLAGVARAFMEAIAKHQELRSH